MSVDLGIGDPRGTLVLIHTVRPLVAEFDERCRTSMPEIRTFHILDEPLLECMKERGRGSASDVDRLVSHIVLAEQAGADVVLVTCSTVSTLVDAVRARTSLPVVGIDEAMAAEAVRSGRRIVVLATSETTIAPSTFQLRDAARKAGREVEVTTVVVGAALSALLAGDVATHDRLVQEAIRKGVTSADVIVLAQASMSRAVNGMSAIGATPVLASPAFALGAVARILSGGRARTGVRDTA